MGVVFPSEAIARRWDGALQARLLRVPLENFLRFQGLSPAVVGASQDIDNVTRATVLIFEAGVGLLSPNCLEGLRPSQQSIIGHLACVASRALADSIGQPGAWRIAALRSSAQLMSPRMGLTKAALAAASSVRRFQDGLTSSPMDTQIALAAYAMVATSSAAAMTELSDQVAIRLGCDIGFASNSQRTELKEQLARS